ncbi:hypothetical protein [Kitasatospora sp. NPDC004272]
MGQPRRPNHALRVLLTEAAWSAADLAAAVNRVAAESGTVLGYDRSAVAHWLAGTRPRAHAVSAICEALARRLGRPVSPADAGLADGAVPDPGPTPPPGGRAVRDRAAAADSASVLLQLGCLPVGAGPRRAGQRSDVTYSVAALVDAERRVADGARPAPAPEPPPSWRRRVEPFEVQAAEAIALVFHRDDRVFGGGGGRRALSAFLASELSPKLHRPAGPVLRQRLLAVTGRLAYLNAFMHFDDNLHGVAQRYYLTALQLADENNSPLDAAVALRGMSVQAYRLGHVREAIALAERAVGTVRGTGLQHAFVHGQLAVAQARDGARRQSLHAMATAERLLGRASSPADTVAGAYHRASLLRQQAAVREHLGDLPGATQALRESVRRRPPDERRSRALTLADLGTLLLRTGELTEAVDTWHRFLDDYPGLASGRADAALTNVVASLRPHARQREVHHLLQRSAHLRSTSAFRGRIR